MSIWGPAILIQVDGELNTGICTFSGQLHFVTASHPPLAGHLYRVRNIPDAAGRSPRWSGPMIHC